jgi:hypothetical protein
VKHWNAQEKPKKTKPKCGRKLEQIINDTEQGCGKVESGKSKI